MQRLSGTDTVMLSAETPAWHYHIGGLTIIAPDGDPRETLDRAARDLRDRLPLAPKFLWKLQEVPFNLGLPVWVRDDDFDFDRHVRRVVVPPPGGPRELSQLAGRILSYQLDRRFPLWEMWLIEGLANNRAATLMKTHHCLMDGVSGSNLSAVLFDLEPYPKETPMPSGDEPEVGPTPSSAALLASALPYAAHTPWRVFRYGTAMARRGLALASYARGNPVPHLIGAPKTSLNDHVGPRRALGFSSISLTDVRALKNEHNVKVNDVVLAVCAGALRNYLADNGEPVDRPLVTAVPVSLRRDDSTTMNNQIGNMFIELATDIADPVERLRKISENSGSAKDMNRALRVHEIRSLGETAPPALLHLALRAIYESTLFGRLPTPPGNTVISNVPGPPFSLYSGGGLVTGMFACSVIIDPGGLNITVFSYGDRLDFGITVDPDIVSDPFRVADGIPVALAELMEASGLGQPTPVQDPFGNVEEVNPGVA